MLPIWQKLLKKGLTFGKEWVCFDDTVFTEMVAQAKDDDTIYQQ